MNFMGSRGFQPMGGMGMSNGLGMGIGMPSGALSPMAGAGSSMSPPGGMSPQSDMGNMIGNNFGIMPANDSRLPSDVLSRGMPQMQGGPALNPGLPSDQTAKSTSASAPLALKADSLSVAEKAAIADLINGIAKLRDSLGEDPHTPLPLLQKQEAEAVAEQKYRHPESAEEEQKAKQEPEKAAEVKSKKEEVREEPAAEKPAVKPAAEAPAAEAPAAEAPAAEAPAAEAPAAEAPAAEAPAAEAPAAEAPAAEPAGGKGKKSKVPKVEAKTAPPAPAAETDTDAEQQDASVHGMVSEAKEEFNFTIPADPPRKAAPAAKHAGSGQDKRALGVPYERRAAAMQGIIDWAKTDPDFGNIPSQEAPAVPPKTLPPLLVAEAAHVQEGNVAFKWQSPVRPMLCAEALFSYPILGIEEDEVVEPLVW